MGHSSSHDSNPQSFQDVRRFTHGQHLPLANWNHISVWLRQLDGLKGVA